MAITDGLYELRSMLLTSMCADISSGSTAKGANVQLYATNDTDAQKFVITATDTDEWSIVNAKSAMYVDVNGGAAANGTNVQQWTSNGTRAQRWKIMDSGNTETVNGVSCPVVTIGSYVTADGATYVMDVKAAMTTNSTNIQIWTANSTDAQSFALLPTTRYDSGMPVPSGLGWAESVGGVGQTSLPGAATLYPCWSFTDAWGDLSTHGFEYSYRTRSTADDSATPGSWGTWSAWTTASVTTDGTRAWLTSGISGTVAVGYKSMDVNLRVRPTATVGGVDYHGAATSVVLTALYVPTVSVSAAALGPDAVTLAVGTTYGGGTTDVRVTSLYHGTTEYLAEPVAASGTGATLYVDVPLTALTDVPNPSTVTSLDVTLEVGTDQYAPRGSQTESAVTYGWDAKATLSLTPTLDWTTMPATLLATIGVGDVKRGWVFVEGEARELDVASGKAAVPYPFGVACSYYVSGEKSDGTAFGGYVGTIGATDSNKAAPCHAWNWDGKAFMLAVNSGQVVTSRNVTGVSAAHDLLSRPWQAVTFAETMHGSVDAAGVLYGNTGVGTLMELVRAHHALYRAPSGEMMDVAIDGVQYESAKNMTNVAVSMTQEAR